jgi:hypothetical protein
MSQQSSKRSASQSAIQNAMPNASPPIYGQRMNVEHLQQDEIVKRRLVGKGGKPRNYCVDNEISMASILKYVADVAAEGPHSHLHHVSAEIFLEN